MQVPNEFLDVYDANRYRRSQEYTRLNTWFELIVSTIELAPSGGVAELAWALKQANLVPSTSEARRLVEQGGVEVDGTRAADPKLRLEPGKEYLVRAGSKNRRFARIRVKA